MILATFENSEKSPKKPYISLKIAKFEVKLCKFCFFEVLGGLLGVERGNVKVFEEFLFGPLSENLEALLEYSNTRCF